MLKYFVYFKMLLVMFVLFLYYGVCFYFMNFSVLLMWLIYSFNSMNIEFILLIDWLALLFISFIFFISSMIILYSIIYMGGSYNLERFLYLLVLFVFFMVLMIISPSMVSILFGWDGLGVISYCLIIFYQNIGAYNSGMVTILCNRLGDIGLMMAISLNMIKGGWSVNMFMDNKIIMFMLMLAALTKSAQIPFSVWLPMAMAAPTPISALVHSSTLVTAGVYLVIRFNKFMMNNGMGGMMLFLSVMTMFMASLMACLEYDLKKIVALSTLSQLGLMMMILSLGLKMISFYHLLTHAIFKSLLFMCAGIIIHSMNNNQDIRLLGNLQEIIPFTMMSFLISNLALCGFPFLAGFYSKDLIMELIYDMSKVNIYILMLSIISLMFTVVYSVRLVYYIYVKDMKFYSFFYFKENFLMNYSMMSLMILSIMIGSILNWMFFYEVNLVYLSFNEKILTISMCVMGVLLGVLLSIFNFMKIFYKLSYFLSSMWFLNNMYFVCYKFNMEKNIMIYYVDKSWLEFFFKNLSYYLIKDFGVFQYKIYMFSLIFIFWSMIFFIFY